MQPMLSVTDLTVRYGAVKAVRDVNLHVGQGEIVALLGANGAGKTTILSSLVGLTPAYSGVIRFKDSDITARPTEDIVRQGLTMVAEGRRIFPSLSIEDNLRLGAATLGSRQKYLELKEEMGELFPILRDCRTQLAGTFSGGQQQQLAIARALMSAPDMLLLDEPSLGLAPQIIDEIFAHIARLKTRGLTILLVEQNATMALEIADRAYVLANGEIKFSSTPDQICDQGAIEAAYLAHDMAELN